MKVNTFRTLMMSAVVALGGLATSCNTLDIKNLESYDESTVWSDNNLATAYVNNLYAETFPNWGSRIDNNSEQLVGVVFKENYITETSSEYKQWTYTTIRHINEAIKRLEDKDNPLGAEVSKSLLGQCYFMRAYTYYWMVMYHGGVPYIKVPQDKDVDDLYVKRNTTAECFQFMIDDIDHAVTMLPEKIKSSSSDYGRIDQCFAKAWKAKTLLLKASPQFNPTKPYNNAYWSEAYTAAKEAYDLCVKNDVKLTEDYNKIWIEEKGPEVIFAVVNASPNKVADYWEDSTRPASVSRNPNYKNPTWEMVKAFPMADGKAYNDPTGAYAKTENELMQSFWMNRDPRFDATVMYNGKLYPVAGKPSGYRQYNALGISYQEDAYGNNPNAQAVAVHNDDYTGFYLRKGSDDSLDQSKVQAYDIDYILMRFAELKLILAEAAVEANHEAEAVQQLKDIRKRAGIEAGADGNYGMNLATRESIREAVQFERHIELCFEGHRFWDLRRTRNLKAINGLIKHGIEAIPIDKNTGKELDITEANKLAKEYKLTPADFKYVMHVAPMTAAAEHEFVIDEDKFYFFPIMKTYLDENQNLQQNNNWGGSFNPTME